MPKSSKSAQMRQALLESGDIEKRMEWVREHKVPVRQIEEEPPEESLKVPPGSHVIADLDLDL